MNPVTRMEDYLADGMPSVRSVFGRAGKMGQMSKYIFVDESPGFH